MDLPERAQDRFTATIDTLNLAQTQLAEPIGRAAEIIVNGLLGGGKILACGNGGTAALSQHFTTRMMHRFERERPSLPALALAADSETLTALAIELDFREVFARQIGAIGHPGDLLLAVSTDGHAANTLRAVEVAHERQLQVIALTGGDGGMLGEILGHHDVEIRAPSDVTARILETHLVTIHCLCDLVDAQLLGN